MQVLFNEGGKISKTRFATKSHDYFPENNFEVWSKSHLILKH